MNESKKGTVGWLKEFAAPHKSGYVSSVIFAVIGVAFSILPYFFIAKMIIHLLSGDKSMLFYIRYCLMAIAVWVGRYIFHGISTTLSHKATFSVISEVRIRLADKLTKLPMGYVLNTSSGTLKNIMVEKVDSIETTLAHIVPEMTANVLVSLGTVIYLFTLDWRIALSSLITIPIGLACYMMMMKDYEPRFNNYVAKNKYLNDTAVEYINGIEVIKAFNQSAQSYEKFTTAALEAANSAIDWMKATLTYFSGAMSIFPAVLVGILPIGCIIYMNGSLDANTFITAIIVGLGIIGPLITTMSYSDDLGKISSIINDISSILEEPDMVRDSDEKKINKFDIELKNVSFSYKEDKVLKNVNLKINGDSVTALVGPSGGGKSTIAKLIASMWDIDEGNIYIGGTDIRQFPLSQVNDMISYVSQDNYLFDDTVRNNIRMGRTSATDEEVEQAAKASGCHEFIVGLENGYETICGGGGGHLSGGERQRIAIARAMLKNAPIIILDEATAYTDPENEAVIQSAVSKLVEGKTLIVIAHRLSTITDSDKIVLIHDGKVEDEGTQAQLLKSSKLYESMWNAHISAKDSEEEAGS